MGLLCLFVLYCLLRDINNEIHTCFLLTIYYLSRLCLCVCLLFLELYYDRGNHHEFVSLVKDLARPGELTQSQTFDFEFTHVEKPYESYTGQNVKLR